MIWSRRSGNACPPSILAPAPFCDCHRFPRSSCFLGNRHGSRPSQAVPLGNGERARRVLRGGHFCAKMEEKAEGGTEGKPEPRRPGSPCPLRPARRYARARALTERCPVFRASPRRFCFLHTCPASPLPTPPLCLPAVIPLPGAKPPLRKDPLCCCFTSATESRSITPIS